MENRGNRETREICETGKLAGEGSGFFAYFARFKEFLRLDLGGKLGLTAGVVLVPLTGVRKPELTRTRIIAAFAVSVVADALQFPINAVSATGLLALPGEAADMGLDIVVMIVTCALLGFHWALLPTFVLEAVPGVNLIPTWTGCVAFVVWRRKKEEASIAPR